VNAGCDQKFVIRLESSHTTVMSEAWRVYSPGTSSLSFMRVAVQVLLRAATYTLARVSFRAVAQSRLSPLLPKLFESRKTLQKP